MGWISLLAIALALALDAFAVATVAGLTLDTFGKRHLFRLSFHFGFFQAAMLWIGWYVGSAVQHLIASVDHWIAFALLAAVGGNIIRNAMRVQEDAAKVIDPTRGFELVFLSVATSVDALAVGLSLAVVKNPIAFPALVVGIIAASLTLVGMHVGRRISSVWGRRCELFGGAVLIAIGAKIVFDHLSNS
jgi:putative cofactor-binding repeat protein